jgi:quaternary ammonium compound-resistance protein SugE
MLNHPAAAWIILLLAGLCEIGWAAAMKASQGFTRPLASVLAIVGSLVSFFLLGFSMRTLPIGTSYAIWTGIGAVGAAICGVLFWGEAATPLRIGCVLLIVLGMIGLKLSS